MAVSAARKKPVVAGIPETPGLSRREPGSTRRAGSKHPLILFLSITALAAPAGCDGDTADSLPQPSPTVSAPANDARGIAEERALAAYRGMWQAYAKAGLTANPDEPDLARHASDEALQVLKAGLASYQSKGHVIKGKYGSNPRIAEASPPADPKAVSVTDCLDTRNFLTYKSSGEPVDDEPGGFRLTRATITNLGAEGWKVTSFGVQAVGTCG